MFENKWDIETVKVRETAYLCSCERVWQVAVGKQTSLCLFGEKNPPLWSISQFFLGGGGG